MIPTAYLLKKYQKIYKDAQVQFAFGSDIISDIQTWEEYEETLKYQKFIVFERKETISKIQIKQILPETKIV